MIRVGSVYGLGLPQEVGPAMTKGSSMKKYRDKNPAFDYQVEAAQVNQSTAAELARFGDNGVAVEIDPETKKRTVGVNIPTQLGMERASEAEGDWVIRNSKGMLFVMGDETFKQHYEEVDAPGKHRGEPVNIFKNRGGKVNNA